MFGFLNSFWLRQLIAAANSTVEKKPEIATKWPDFFDNTDGIGSVKRPLFYKDKRSGILLPFKGRSAPVAVEDKIGVEVHITAVAYGTTKKARAFWTRLIRSGELDDTVIELFSDGVKYEVMTAEQVANTAERMALHQRFWKAEYHYIGLLNGDILHNNDITRYTFHGSGGNSKLIGVSGEGNFPGLEKKRKKKHHGWTPHEIETNRGALRLAVLNSREDGAPVERLYAHRQYSGGRIADPGEGYWKEIGIPIAKELNLERMTFQSFGKGREICREWDEEARVNYWGN